MPEATMKWIKSSYCETGACVEVAHMGAEIVMRNNTRPDDQHLRLDRQRWSDFVDDIRDGQFSNL